ncbi:hypothetical protein MRX96_026847 [Rhipicephalus microplus]
MGRQPWPPFREKRLSAGKPQPWHDDDASRRPPHGSPVFDQIIVETVQQPARHRPSLAFILVVFVIGLFMGALALLLCVLCLLKTLSGRYWPVAQKDDIFFMIESHEKLLANTKFQKQKANEPADTPMANKESDVEGSARGAIKSAGSVMYSTRNDQQNTRKAPLLSAQDEPTYETPRGDFLEPQYCRDMHQHTPGSSNWKRHTFKSSGNVQHRQELYSDDENVSGHSGARGLSNLRLDFRINEKSSCKSDSTGGGLRQHPPDSSSSSSYSINENTVVSQASKSRPLRFCLSPEKEKSQRPQEQEYTDGCQHAQFERNYGRSTFRLQSQSGE